MKKFIKKRRVFFGILLLFLPLLTSPDQVHSQSWEKLVPDTPSGAPAGRMNHTSVYDPGTNRLIIYGGETGIGNCNTSCILDDVWVLENANGIGGTPIWTRLFPTWGTEGTPIKRLQHSAVYDPYTNCMIVFGGMRTVGYGGDMNDVWVLENANGLSAEGNPVNPIWRQIVLSYGPSPRRLHHAFFDTISHCMIIFGGYPDKDVWRLEHPSGIGGTPEWTQLSSGLGLPIDPGNLQLAVYDNTNNRLSVLSGYNSPRQFWVFTHANGYDIDPSQWILLDQTGTIPYHFHFPAFVFDPAFSQMIICGGASNLPIADVWEISNANGLSGNTSEWDALEPSEDPNHGLPQGRDTLKAVFDEDSRRMIMFGGRIGVVAPNNIVTNDVWVLNLTDGTTGDTTPPVITTPGDITAEATDPSGAAVEFVVTALDDIDGQITPESTPASGSTFPLGDTPVNCTATDAAGNTATETFTITVQDTTPPTITTSGNLTVEATDSSGAVVVYSVTAEDDVDGAVAVTCTPASDSTFSLGVTTVTCEATDVAGNTVTESFTITVQDTTPPIITTPGNMTVEATSSSGATVTFAASANDDVDGVVFVTCTPASDSTFSLGDTTVDCTATDAAGNSATSSFTITVQDTSPPSITAPADVTAEATGPLTSVDLGDPTVTDLADSNPTVTNDAPAAGFPVGTTEVTWTATDASGNQATDTQLVILQASPSIMVAQLKNSIIILVMQGELDRRAGKTLANKLDKTLKALNRGKIKTAKNQLKAFKNKVKALNKSGKISRELVQSLLQAANLILRSL